MLRICPQGATKLVRQRMCVCVCVLRREGECVCDSQAALGFTYEGEKKYKWGRRCEVKGVDRGRRKGEKKMKGEKRDGGRKFSVVCF